jgi:hypothetical protein
VTERERTDTSIAMSCRIFGTPHLSTPAMREWSLLFGHSIVLLIIYFGKTAETGGCKERRVSSEEGLLYLTTPALASNPARKSEAEDTHNLIPQSFPHIARHIHPFESTGKRSMDTSVCFSIS